MEVGVQRHTLIALLPVNKLGTHCAGGLLGPRASLDECDKSRPTGIPPADRPARNESLYWLSYPGPRLVPVILPKCLIKLTDNFTYKSYLTGEGKWKG
jgi:hypothetical protein